MRYLIVPEKEAVMVAVSVEGSPTVVTLNEAVVAPAATVTEAGTVTSAVLDVKVTTVPPLEATRLSVTVPVEFAPPATVDGLTATPCNNGVWTTSTAV